MGFLRKDHVMGVLEDDRVGTMACYESKRERDIVKFCYDSMEHVLDRLPQYRPDNMYEDAKDANVPGKWIPCSERLPEIEVICCDLRGNIIIGNIEKDGDGFLAESDEKIMYDCIAWMPLPDPYKGGKA